MTMLSMVNSFLLHLSLTHTHTRTHTQGVYPVTQRTPTGLKTLWSAEVFEKYDRVVLGVFSCEEAAHTVYEERMKELGEGGGYSALFCFCEGWRVLLCDPH